MTNKRVRIGRIGRTAAGAAVIGLAAACGVIGMTAQEDLACADGVEADVTVGGGNFMDTWLFSPSPVTIRVGQSVCFVNVDGRDHTVTPNVGTGFGGSLTAMMPYLVDTFTVAGDYPYHCQIHEAEGMAGVVHVTP